MREFLGDIESKGRTTCACMFHIPLQIDIQKFKNQVKFLVSMDDVQELDNIFVVKFLQQTNFANGSARHPLVFRFQPYLLESNNLICAGVARFVDNTVCA